MTSSRDVERVRRPRRRLRLARLHPEGRALRGETGSAPGVKTRSILGVWTLALAVAAIAILIIATSDHTNDKLALILLAVPIELAFVASGLVARAQRPHNRTGLLLIFVGFSWFFGALPSAGNDVRVHRGPAARHLLHRAARTPAARLPDRRADDADRQGDRDRVLRGRGDRPAARVRVRRGRPLERLLRRAVSGQRAWRLRRTRRSRTRSRSCTCSASWCSRSLVLVRLVRRWRGASPALRRALAPVFATAGLLIGTVLRAEPGRVASPSEPPRW